MRKTGKQRNPSVLVILLVISCGLYGIVWISRTLDELRNYRNKGLPGFSAIQPYVPITVNLILPILILLIALYYFFPFLVVLLITPFIEPILILVTASTLILAGYVIPFYIHKEKFKLGIQEGSKVFLSIIPVISTLFYLILLLNLYEVLDTSSYFEDFYFIISLGIISVYYSWIYILQQILNQIWEIVLFTHRRFATPVKFDPLSQSVVKKDNPELEQTESENILEQNQLYAAFPDYDTYEDTEDETDEENLDDSEGR